MHFHPFLAPIKIGVLPLSAKLTDKAQPIFEKLSKKYMCELDDRQSIGKRYRRQDEIGTPYCVVYDFDSETDGCVTIRERDSMKNVEYEPGNIRFPIDKLEEFFEGRMVQNKDWFMNNNIITSSYSFVKKILDSIARK
jgi:glycyl-tRNA synthetase